MLGTQVMTPTITVIAGALLAAAQPAPIEVTPTHSGPPNPASIHDGRGDVMAFEIDNGLHPVYRVTVRCRNGKVGYSPRMEQWQEAIDQAFADCGAS